jgi:hypothetical protein
MLFVGAFDPFGPLLAAFDVFAPCRLVLLWELAVRVVLLCAAGLLDDLCAA